MPPQPNRTGSNPATGHPVPALVLDTSILLMAVTRPNSQDRWLRNAWHDGYITPLTSDATENEFQRTLRKPELDILSELIRDLARDYLDYCTKLTVVEAPRNTPECRDPNDQPFLDLAYYARADYLGIRDDDLLSIRDL